MSEYDFSGWATKNNIRCADGRTIRQNAFADDDGKVVPLVWMHQHDDPNDVLGHALLENRPEGVYAYGKFNDTADGQQVKELVKHGDITSLSIYANHLKQTPKAANGDRDVIHGSIKELSLVLAGANDGATIENVMMAHGDDWQELEDEVEIRFYQNFDLAHSDDDEEKVVEEPKEEKNEETENEEEKDDTDKMAEEKTVKDVYETLTPEQKKVVEFLVGAAVQEATGKGAPAEDDDDEAEHADYEGETFMKHNVFDNEREAGPVISHADMEHIFTRGKQLGSLKDAVMEYADENNLSHADGDYGIADIDYLFPDARTLTNTPEFIKRETEWVGDFMSKTKKTPFSRIKSIFADITADEARAKGYVKGKKKLEEVFTLLKRTTTPTTIYKKQKLDRDDVIDITDFDVLAWIKQEMKIMMDEEIARAALLGDGRSTASDDKIKEDCIRPIVSDDDLYTIKVKVGTEVTDYAELIKTIIRARKNYKGSGNPTFYTTEDVLTEMLLLEDKEGRPLYDTVEKLCTKLRVSAIKTVEAMEAYNKVVGIIVNPADYTFGADKGGETSFFEDFDIDYNQQKYLYEGRCSGALVKPYSAMAILKEAASDTE